MLLEVGSHGHFITRSLSVHYLCKHLFVVKTDEKAKGVREAFVTQMSTLDNAGLLFATRLMSASSLSPAGDIV